jgi:DNA-directed RNA polymerase specialized sigma24 family protein
VASPGSITQLLGLLQTGDLAAVQPLWERYFPRLVRWAREKLRNAPRATADEEDVALSAFDSFCRGAEQGRFPQLGDRDSLWRLLLVLTARKAARVCRDAGRHKRSGPAETSPAAGGECTLEEVLSREPDPELAAQVAEQCQLLLRSLRDKELEAVALWRMEGYTVAEVAERLGCAPRSVKRKLRTIRAIWEEVDRE